MTPLESRTGVDSSRTHPEWSAGSLPLWGEVGWGSSTYNARWYDPALGRFAQADSIVPPGAQGWDRYAYVNNNPVNYTDPTGHDRDCAIGRSCERDIADAISWKFRNVRIKNPEGFRKSELDKLYRALNAVFLAFGRSQRAFLGAFGEVTFTMVQSGSLPHGAPANAEIWGRGTAKINLTAEASFSNIIHEMGHAFDSVYRRRDGSPLLSQLFVWEFNQGTCQRSPCYDNGMLVHGRAGTVFQKNTAWLPVGGPTYYGRTSSLEDFADSFDAEVLGSVGVDSPRKNLIRILILLHGGS